MIEFVLIVELLVFEVFLVVYVDKLIELLDAIVVLFLIREVILLELLVALLL